MRFTNALAAILLSAAVAAAAESPPPAAGHVSAYIVVDTRITTLDVTDELKVLGEALIKAMKPGDRVQLLSAHWDRPRLHALVSVTAADDRADLRRALADIRPEPVGIADLAAALDLVRMSVEKDPGANGRVAVLVLSDSRLIPDEVDKFVGAVKTLEGRGAHVLTTGVDGASRKLLDAAARGNLKWCHPAEADPARWLEEIRKGKQAVKPASSATPEPTPPPVAKPADSSKSDPTDSKQGKETKPSPVPNPPTPPKEPAKVALPTIPSDDTNIEKKTNTFLPRDPAVPLRVPRPDNTTNDKAETSPTTKAAPIPASDAQEKSTVSAENRASGVLMPGPSKSDSRLAGWVWALAVLVLLVAGFIGLMVRDFIKSRSVKEQEPEAEGDKPSVQTQILASANGREINLGLMKDVKKIDIGSGPAADVPITGDDIQPRHATLKRKGPDFWLRNHARKRIVANGVPMDHRKCQRVSLPLDLTLNGKDKVSLHLNREALVAEVAGSKEENHE